MKRQILFIILTFICFNYEIYAQSNFKKGFIVTEKRDTIYGLVDFRQGSSSFKSCIFKESENKESKKYSPDDIAGYGIIDDKIFESRKIVYRGQQAETLFIEVIIKGLASLYKYHRDLYIEKDGKNFNALKNDRVETTVNGRTVTSNSHEYLSVLNSLFYDCSTIQPLIKKTTLSQRSLLKLLSSYNKCMNATYAIHKEDKKAVKVIKGIAIGGNISSMAFKSGDARYSYLTHSFEKARTPVVMVSFDVLAPRLNQRFSLHFDVMYRNSKNYSFSIEKSSPTTSRNFVTIELTELKIPIGLRYTFPEKKFTPYFNLGFSNTFTLRSHSELTKETETAGVVRINHDPALVVAKNQFGIWGSIGIMTSLSKKINGTLEFRCEKTDGIGNYVINVNSPLKSSITNFQISLGIRTK
jgi:hypothetical protein